jgi:DNA-binding GntR family transcriptional regulator
MQLRDEAASYIREAIISGQVPPNSTLRLAPLAETLRMSMTPVREAFLLLAQTGWVIQERNVGFRVAQLKKQDVLDGYFVNRLVAEELAARAATMIDDETVALLQKLDDQVRASGPTEAETAPRLNAEIHQIIYGSADSPRLQFFIDSSSLFVPRQFWGTIDGWLEHNRTGHADIIAALAERNSAESRRLMGEHIEEAGELLVSHLVKHGFFER